MFSEKLPRLQSTLALRLTFWYAAIFAVSSMIAFAFVYVLVVGFVAERTDEELRQDIDDFAALYAHEGFARVAREVVLDTQGEEAEKVFFRLWGENRRLLTTTSLSAWTGLAPMPDKALGDIAAGGQPIIDTLELPSREHRVRWIIGSIGPGVTIEIGQSLEDDEAFVAEMLHGFVLALAMVLLFGGPIGWFMARRALHGVKEVTHAAKEIAEGALDRRVPVGSQGDELDDLASTFNTMLDRIQTLIVGMRDMTDNLAHDLRSPLTRIRAVAEMSLVQAGVHDARESLADNTLAINTMEECDRLLEMLNTTLDIAEADSGAARLNIDRLDFSRLVLTACELYQTVAEDNRVKLVIDVPERCPIQADRQRLQRVIANLLDNAFKYTPAEGRIRVALQLQNQQVKLAIEDTGIGIATQDLPRIFQRFYRCDPSRSQQGIGLGLSLARAFVRAHGGEITVTSTRGVGSVFTVVLPQSMAALTSLDEATQHPVVGHIEPNNAFLI